MQSMFAQLGMIASKIASTHPAASLSLLPTSLSPRLCLSVATRTRETVIRAVLRHHDDITMGAGMSLVSNSNKPLLVRWPRLHAVNEVNLMQAVAIGIPLVGGTISGLSTVKEIPKWCEPCSSRHPAWQYATASLTQSTGSMHACTLYLSILYATSIFGCKVL
jgi:hypothetical protein